MEKDFNFIKGLVRIFNTLKYKYKEKIKDKIKDKNQDNK